MSRNATWMIAGNRATESTRATAASAYTGMK